MKSARLIEPISRCMAIPVAFLTIFLGASDAGGTTFTTLDDPLATGGLTAATGVSGNTIVGNYKTSNGVTHGFIYNGSTYTTLDEPLASTPGLSQLFNGTNIEGISGSVIVGGYSSTAIAYLHGFTYNGTTFATFDPPGGTLSQADGISGSQIVGTYVQGHQVGYLYNGSTFVTLDDPLSSGHVTLATGVSGSTVVGNYFDSAQISHGFLYNGSTYTTLNAPLGTNGTSIFGIDGLNIVGSYTDSANITHGFWYNGSSFVTIDDPLATGGFTAVGDISGNTIVGSYKDLAGVTHAFVANIPEPSSVVLAVIGAFCLIAAASSRRH